MPGKLLTLVSDNSKPEKAAKVRRAPKVSPYCPACKSGTWIMVNEGPADVIGMRPRRKRCCVHCLSKGKVTTW